MNFTYFKFLFINTIKRKPVWITWLLFLFTCTCFIIILPLAAKMNTLQIWANTTMTICQTFLGMTAALFTAILAINVFKEGNEEGTELIVVSKPITRLKIVVTKFLLFGFFCLLVNISAVLISMFTAFLPRTEPRFYWGLVISMLIGNAVTFAVFGSIAILMTVKFAKVGVIITNIVLSLVFLIYQALTLFVFTTPTKALADSKIAAPSYILVDRQKDGSYKESEVVKFNVVNLDDLEKEKEIPTCRATNWKEMKHFWDREIVGKHSTVGINVTDIASQISLSYLSYGINDYAYRQANRMFALSRFYNYELTSPASPEIIAGVDNKQTLPWLYTGYINLHIALSEETEIDIYLPQSFGFAGIKPVTTTRLRGYTDKIPVGFTKSKEIASQRDVYFEKEEWNKYGPIFSEMYDKVFDYQNYIDLVSGIISSYTDYDSLFAYSNETVKRYYEIIWNTFMGKDLSVFKNPDGSYKYDASSFDIITSDDINERFIQFKYYCYFKALEEQQNLLTGAIPSEHQEYWQSTKDSLQETADNLALNIEYDKWMIKARNGLYFHVLEPNTQTISYQLIQNEWDSIPTWNRTYELAHTSALSIMKKTAAIFDIVCETREKYLFDSTVKPTRNAKLTGEAFMVNDYWVPYPISLYIPMGQNMQYFFYKIHPVINYWNFAVIWGCISLGLFTAGAIVYNKYDVK